jgi:chromosome segregation and condensation protein ScpB
LYATTKYFLDDFGLKELGELPDINISKEGFSNDIDTPKLPENLPEDIND